MANGQTPDFRVTFPVTTGKGESKKTVWNRLGAAWKREGGSIGIVLDVGVALTFPPGAQLVLVENEPPEDDAQGRLGD
jgi:hypothetical protein